MVTQASYAANTPVDSPGFTTVCISTNGALVADLENSYITAKIKYYFTMADLQENGFTKAKIDAEADAGVAETKFTKYFIGFKQSLDALRRYDVNVNSQTIYSQNFVGHESFVQVAGLNEHTHTHYACLRCALRAPLRLRWSSWLVCSTGCDGGEKIGSSRVGLTSADHEICAAQVPQHSKRSPGSKRSLISKRSLRGKRSLRCKNVKVL